MFDGVILAYASLRKIQQNCSVMTFFCGICEGTADWLPEIFYKITGIVKTYIQSNVRHRCICMQKQGLCLFKSVVIQVGCCCFSGILFEQLHKIEFTVIGKTGQFLYRQRLTVMGTDIVQDLFYR